MPAAEIRLDHVTRSYKLGDGSTLRAADDVTLEIPAGTRTALIGVSGSGKSTLLHLIGGIDRPDVGTITVGDTEVTALKGGAMSDYRSRIGFIFQQFHLIPSLSVLDNVLIPLSGRDRKGKQRALELLDAVGLADRPRALPSQLSGGQQQRVAIARALVVQPQLLLADEPTGNLDSETAAQILHLIADLQSAVETTVVIATHDNAIAEICPQRIRITDGQAAWE